MAAYHALLLLLLLQVGYYLHLALVDSGTGSLAGGEGLLARVLLLLVPCALHGI